LLYKYILKKAGKIVVREKFSYDIAKNILSESDSFDKVILYHDFSLEILNNFIKTLKYKNIEISKNYVLINLSVHALSSGSYEKIEKYCKDHSQDKKIYFYSDYYDDKNYYENLKKIVPNLEFYDWTKHDIFDTLELFYKSI